MPRNQAYDVYSKASSGPPEQQVKGLPKRHVSWRPVGCSSSCRTDGRYTESASGCAHGQVSHRCRQFCLIVGTGRSKPGSRRFVPPALDADRTTVCRR